MSNFVAAAKYIADRATSEVLEEFALLTGGLNPHQVIETRNWLAEHDLQLPNLQSETVTEALELVGLGGDVRRALEIRELTAATSLKKLDAMPQCVGADGRARGLL